MSTKVATKVQSLLDRQIRKILVSESNDLSLSNQQGELILTCIIELAQLHTPDLRAGGWSESADLGAFWQKALEAWVGIFAVLDVLKWLPWWVLLTVVPDRQVVWVLAGIST
jgi:hypothetical protein